jgi:hypothetical protein
MARDVVGYMSSPWHQENTVTLSLASTFRLWIKLGHLTCLPFSRIFSLIIAFHIKIWKSATRDIKLEDLAWMEHKSTRELTAVSMSEFRNRSGSVTRAQDEWKNVTLPTGESLLFRELVAYTNNQNK